jgi:Protein of unknown function (DUF3152)
MRPGLGGVPVRDPRPKPREIARARRRRRERRYRIIALVVLIVAAGGVAADLVRERLAGPGAGRRPAGAPAGRAGSEVPGPAPLAGPAGGAALAPGPSRGPGTFGYATGTGAVLGTAGALHRYRVAVENGTGQRPDEFAAFAERVLADGRGWTAGGSLRFQRVPQGGAADFTLYLATAGTSEHMCAQGGLHTGGYTSCRLPGQVIINLARWLGGVAGYGAPLPTYRQYALNHEIGRELGYGNESCPGPHQPAPVMQQQTLGLSGCAANAWPYLGGKLYQGTPIP